MITDDESDFHSHVMNKPKVTAVIDNQVRELDIIPKKKIEVIEEKINPSLGEKFLNRMFVKTKKIEVRTWILDGIETSVDKAEVKLGTEQVEIRGKLYDIDYPSIQNQFGKLVYNIRHNDSTGALRYSKPKLATNAKNAKDMLQRNWLTALWSNWKMPLIIALIAIGVAIVLGMIAFIMYSDGQKKEAQIQNLIADKARLETQFEILLNSTRINTPSPIPPINSGSGSPSPPRGR